MSVKVRKGTGEVEYALVGAYNKLLKKVTQNLSTYPHMDMTSMTSGDFTAKTASPYLVTAANASSLGTSITLANELKLVFNTHCADAVAHLTADEANVVEEDDAETLLAEVETLLNAIKAAYNAHLTESGVHYTDDTTNDCSTADATDQSTANALANDLKTKLNAHIQFALGADALELVGP